MRLVKRSVNQDDPTTYHLFDADAEGRIRRKCDRGSARRDPADTAVVDRC
jgi:catechol 2,3-dioxygenase-like lactoylglutathione lyase family enzyme